jgi:[citrate (pro-3S)-lyase] ligase
MSNRLSEIKELQDYLLLLDKLKDNFLLIVASCGKWHQNAEKLLEYIDGWGVHIQPIANSFFAVFDKDTIIYSQSKDTRDSCKYECCHNGTDICITANPHSKQSEPSSISINSQRVIIQNYGISIVLYDSSTGQVVDAVNFNTIKRPAKSFRIKDFSTGLFQKISEIGFGFGYTIAQWLVDFGYSTVSIYIESECEELARSVVLPIKLHKEIEIRNIFSNSKKSLVYFLDKDFSASGIAQFDENSLSEGEILIHIGYVTNRLLEEKIKVLNGEYFTLNQLVTNAHFYIETESVYLNLMNKYYGLSVIHFDHINNRISSLIEHQKRAPNRRPKVIDEMSNNLPISSEYVSEHLPNEREKLLNIYSNESSSYTNEYGYRILPETQSEYVNVVGGRRVTYYQPTDYDNTIYVFGGCQVWGVWCSDEETFSSLLQKLLNENITTKRWRVINCGQICVRNFHILARIVANLHPAKGDIILSDTKKYSNSKAKFPTISCADYIQPTKDNYPDAHMFADLSHLSPDGHKWVADSLFEGLIKNNFFEDYPYNKLEYRTKNIPLNGFYQIGTTSDEMSGEIKTKLTEYKQSLRNKAIRVGSLVMNCNPFTLGHRYLIEYAARKVKHLYIFVVEVDKSFFPFSDRFELVKTGTTDLQNITILPSGEFVISMMTFKDYFNKSELQDRIIDPSADVEIFAKEIAPTLGINVRFAGEEPLDNITRQYNESMSQILPQYGIDFEEIPRIESDGAPISASRVRALLQEQNFEKIAKIVPNTTLNYLVDKFATDRQTDRQTV